MSDWDRPRLVPVAAESYRNDEERRRLGRIYAGWSRAYARRNQMLPYAGTGLSPGDAERLHRIVAHHAEMGGTTRELVAAALLSAVLTTGRTVKELTGAITTHAPMSSDVPWLETGPHWRWWLPPGEPESLQLEQPHIPRQPIDRSPLIAIPCSARTRQLIERLAPIYGPLHSDHDVVIDALKRMIRAAGVAAPLSWVERWLFERLAAMEGGDIALAALTTGHTSAVAQTPTHYTRAETDRIPALLARALDGFDTIEDADIPSFTIGSRYAPTLDEVRVIVCRLTAPLERRNARLRQTPVALHNAMTLYTTLFVLFATGARPRARAIPADRAIDAATGFMVLDDKSLHDGFTSRLVWVADACRAQLAHYHVHLSALARRRPDLAELIAQERPFLLSEDDGAPKPLTRDMLRPMLSADHYIFPLNAGRHFLRSQLIGAVSGETLHAFLGHWHLGAEPWGAKGALDPVRYRAELARALPPLLTSAGWRPLPGLTTR